jgi:hypothetical protein
VSISTGKVIAERFGASQEIALTVIDTESGEDLDGFLVANKLSDRVFAHASGDLDDGGNQDSVGFVGGAVADVFTIDLEVVERQVFEVVEGAESGSEVIQRKMAPERRCNKIA